MTVLGLITPQDLRYLTEESREKVIELKKAAGAEDLLWDTPAPARTEARVLEFPKAPEGTVTGREFVAQESPLEAIGVLSAQKQEELKKAAREAYERSKPAEFDLMLTERDKFRSCEEKIFKQNGLQSYQRNSDLRMYRVSVKDDKGKEKTRVTSTLGVLVDKKQA